MTLHSTSVHELVTWVSVPESWLEIAGGLSLAVGFDAESSSTSASSFMKEFQAVAEASEDVAALKISLGAALPEPAGHRLVSQRYIDAIRNLARAVEVDCQVSASSQETFAEMLGAFQEEDAKLMAPTTTSAPARRPRP